jgi:hypothetical protein
MRLARRNLLLAALLAVLVVLDLLHREPERVAASGEPALALRPDDVARIEISRGGEEVALVRSGAGWTVRERDGFAAHGPTVTTLLERLAALSRADLVSSSPDALPLFGLGPGAARLVLADAEGEVLADLSMGRPRDEAGGCYVRVAGSDEAFRSAALAVPEPRPERWLDTRLLDLPIPSVQVIHAELPDGRSFRIQRGEDGRWNALESPRSVTPAAVDPLLLVAANLYFSDLSDVARADAGLETPRATLRFDLEGGELLRLALGDAVPGGRAARRAEWSADWVVVLSERSATSLERAAAQVADALGR